MTYVFWQNIISIHQSAFLKALSENHKVILVVESALSSTRKQNGWDIPKIERVDIIVGPSVIETEKILQENSDACQILSGLGAYKLPTLVLRLCKKFNYTNVIVISESFEIIGFKGILRKVKYKLLSLKYRTIIKAIFVTGMPARRCFENLYFSKDIIYDWGYFTEFTDQNKSNYLSNGIPKLLYVGAIDENKNILKIIPIVNEYKSLYSKFYIVGGGPLVSNLKNLIFDKETIEYKGILKNTEIQDLMKECDLLVLPSLYDGWGAVVNEALSNGMRVLCSDNCGASILLDGKIRGSVFNYKLNNFEEHLMKWLNDGVISILDRNDIIDWSKQHISGTVAATYFDDSITYLSNKQGSKPKAPWL